MMEIETVKVVTDNEQGFKIINKDDFNQKEHVLYGEPKPKATPKAKK